MNLRELNHILIPRWERLERSRALRLLGPLPELAASLTTEGQVVFVAMLIAGAAGIDVRFSHLYLVFSGLVGLLLAAYLCRPLARLSGVSLRVEHPGRVAAGGVATFTVVVRNDGRRPVYALRVRGPFLPWDGSWEGAPPSIAHLAPGTEARVLVRARFLCRGQRSLGRFRVFSVRPLGLVGGRRVHGEPVALTVVPRVARLVGLPPPRHAHGSGERVARSVLAGESFEPHGVRPYRPGDRLRDLHARSWARVGEPIVREHRRPTQQRVAVVLWAVAPKVPREVFDPALELTAGLLAALTRDDVEAALCVAGGAPAPPVRAARGGALEPALDRLALVEAVAEPAPGAAEAVAAAVARAAAAYLVLVRWDEAAAALADRARRSGVPTEVWLVAPGDGDEARAAGVRVLRPGDIATGEVRL